MDGGGHRAGGLPAGPLAAARLQLVPVGIAVALLLVGAVLWVSRRRLSPLARPEIAVQRGEFIVHYQPIIALDSGACVGAEALVRWQQPDGVLVPPDAFIPLAEESGLILPITDLVVAEVIRELGPTLAADPALHVAINVSAEDIKSSRVQSVLEHALRGTGVDSGQLWVEATERSLMDIDAARTTIMRLRGAGHTVSIDDFGTGYSSLQYLQGLPLDALKIDKSFVDTIGTHSATSAVTAHIIEMAKRCGCAPLPKASSGRNSSIIYAPMAWTWRKAGCSRARCRPPVSSPTTHRRAARRIERSDKKAAIGGLSMSITHCAIRLRALQGTAALVHRLGPAREGVAHDPPHHLSELPRQRAGVVVLAVARTDLLHFDGDLRITVGWQVRVEVVFDLVAQIARQHVHQLAAGEVRRPAQLTQIPMTTRFVADRFLREHFRIGGEVAAK